MIYRIILPAPDLQPYIKSYSLLDFVAGPASPALVKPFPAHTDHSLVFYLSGRLNAHDPATGRIEQFTRMAINGIQTRRLNFHLPNVFSMFAINFQPGFLSRFLRMPLGEYTDSRVDAEAILRSDIRELYQRMLDISDLAALAPLAEIYLRRKVGQMKTDWQPIDQVNLIMATPTKLTIRQLAEKACLSLSQFERRFAQQSGVTPKYFTRITRFCHAYSLRETHPGLSWLSVALEAGYEDYQHLVRDFKAFAGELPQALLEAQARSPERILSGA